jgi:ribosomal protein S18 acetylase RimI-like enzyme
MIKIIQAEEKHIPEICKLWVEFMEYTVEIDPIFAFHEYNMTWFEKEHLRPAMSDPDSLVLAACEADKVVGYSYALVMTPMKYERRPKYGNIHDLFVTCDRRRKRVGEKLYQEMLKWFHTRGINRVELHIISQNGLASSFWRKQGFSDFEQKMYREI